MDIALFHATLPQEGRKRGGVEVAVHRLAAALAARPDDRVTVYSTDAPPAGAPYHHERLGSRVPGVDSTLGRLVALPLLLNGVDFGRHDVLHLHGDDWFFVRRRLPTLRTLHGSALREAQTATSWRRRALQYATFPLEHLSARLAGTALAVGRDAAALYRAPVVVDNGVDLGAFRPGPKGPVPTILFVGTWAGRKRGHLIHEVFRDQVRPAVPGAELVMVSDRCDPAPGVRHVPHPSDEELAELYRSAWVFAYPSAYEGFGIAYVEAMASGTAVVTTTNDGARHVLDDGRYGVVSDGRAFGDDVVRLLRDEPARRAMEAAGLRRAERFSWPAVAAAHRDLYERAVRRHGR
jgi:glycosyltransferase involved in cell wall biosynthesis